MAYDGGKIFVYFIVTTTESAANEFAQIAANALSAYGEVEIRYIESYTYLGEQAFRIIVVLLLAEKDATIMAKISSILGHGWKEEGLQSSNLAIWDCRDGGKFFFPNVKWSSLEFAV